MRQESHRIQWQQWGKDPQSKRDLITRSAAVRLTDAATAQNVISLLGESLKLSDDGGSLVLVGTLFHNNPVNIIVFEHELRHDLQPGLQRELQHEHELQSELHPGMQHEHEHEHEHDLQHKQPRNSNSNPASRSASPTTTTASTESFHLVRTLKSDENPLQVRDLMQKVLEMKQQQSLLNQQQQQQQPMNNSSTIAPKVQWFFIPQDPGSQIPSCIELDGYSSGMEDEDMDDADDEEDDDDSYEVTLEPVYPDPMDTPWRRKPNKEYEEDHATTSTSPDSISGRVKLSQKQKRALRQVQRCRQLSLHRSALDHYIVSGFLWKQSHTDPHVWRKVHCVLTEDHLWFVTRIKNRTRSSMVSPYYGRIGLSRALMLIAGPAAAASNSSETATLARIPFSWELVSARGQPHLFRAPSRALQYRWTHCLRDRIRQCEENKLLQQAELIVADETVARTKRLLSHVAVGRRELSSDTPSWTSWALQVVDYREQCRHIQHRLPTKTLVIATSGISLSSQRSSISSQDSSSSVPLLPALEPELEMMVRSAWDLATKLLVEAITAINQHPSTIITNNPSPPVSAGATTDERAVASPRKGGHHRRNLETLCRHIDYVLTGRMRSMSEVGTVSNDGVLVDKSRDAPPLNLLDQLLAELQKSAN